MMINLKNEAAGNKVSVNQVMKMLLLEDRSDWERRSDWRLHVALRLRPAGRRTNHSGAKLSGHAHE